VRSKVSGERGVTLSDAVTTLLSYRTQSWSMSMPIDGLHW